MSPNTFVYAHAGLPIPLGRQGETNARRIVFDISGWLREYGTGGTLLLLHKRPGDNAAYLVPFTQSESGDKIYWDVTDVDTDKETSESFGEAELRYSITTGNTGILAKSELFRTTVDRSLGAYDPRYPVVPETTGGLIIRPVTTRPEVGDEGVVYLVPNPDSEDPTNTYIEWIYINDAWEEWGKYVADVDISGKADLSYTNAQLALKQDTIPATGTAIKPVYFSDAGTATQIPGYVPDPSDANPLMDGVASAGSSATFSRSDHRHASDTTKQDKIPATGGPTHPVYVSSNGVVSQTTYELRKTVPADAVFTDTTYSVATASTNGLMSHTDKTRLDGMANNATANTGTVTSVETGAGLTGGPVTTSGTIKVDLRSETKLENASASATETAGRVYPVALDKDGKLAVNVPWENTQTLTGVKGNAEGTYRTGNVNITPENIGAVPASSVGAANGVAELDNAGKVLASQLPSYVDDVQEYTTVSDFPATGESGKIYIATSTNLTYRWTGSAYTEISPSIALGETSSTAYRGDRGATAYSHSQTTGNPHSTSKGDVGLGNVANYDQSKAIKTITRSGTTFTYTCLDGTTGTFTQQDNNTWTAMTGATSSTNGMAGYVPAPPSNGHNTKYLRADGTWAVPPDNNTNTTYTITQDSNDGHKFTLSGSDGSSTTITIPDNNTTYAPASAAPLMDGAAAVGTSAKYAREDHRHPTDTSRASTAVATVSTPGLLSVLDKWALDAANLDHYDGVDLSARFAAEIAASPYNGDVWAWLKGRCTAQNFDGLYVKDYVQFTTTDNITVVAQIAGINQYRRFNYTALSAYHIDFIGKNLWPEKHVWNKADYNNGLADNMFPYLCSDLKLWLNSEAGAVPNAATVNPTMENVDYTSTGVLARLPAALKNVIVEKQACISRRYTSEGLLTDDTGWGFVSLGKLWVPAEMEVYGCCIWGSKGHSQAAFTQYPIFRDSKMRIKDSGNVGNRTAWWLLTPHSGTSTYAAHLNRSGEADYNYASNTGIGAPVCFRIAG